MKTYISFALAAAMLAGPSAALAQSYHYVDLTGEIKTVEANNASEALLMVSLAGDALHSGVKADVGQLETGQNFGVTYTYQSTSGGTGSVTAATVDAAYILATDIVPGTLVAVSVATGN